MKTNNSLRINKPRALELISFFFLCHGPIYPISDLSGSTITRETVLQKSEKMFITNEHAYLVKVASKQWRVHALYNAIDMTLISIELSISVYTQK